MPFGSPAGALVVVGVVVLVDCSCAVVVDGGEAVSVEVVSVEVVSVPVPFVGDVVVLLLVVGDCAGCVGAVTDAVVDVVTELLSVGWVDVVEVSLDDTDSTVVSVCV